MIRVTAKVRGPGLAEELRAKLRGPEMEALLVEVADDMVAQVRRNVMTEGGPGGKWPQLSGYNARVQQRRDMREAKKAGLEVAKQRKTAASTSRHDGYARQKEVDVAAGRAKFGPMERLRATGGLVAALVARIKRLADRIRVELGADGNAPNGTPYDVVLEANAKGTATIPARDPTANMEQFEKRTGARLQRLLSSKSRSS